MSYFPARLFFKLPFFIALSYLISLCRPLFSQNEVDIINPGINPSSLPRPGFLPCKLNLEDTPEWHDKPQMKEIERQVITPEILQFISKTGGYLPGMTGSPDIDDLFSKWVKKLSQKSNRKPGQPFNQTEANLDFKQPALLAFDPADEGWQVMLTIDEHGHLNASELADDKEEISANLEWEDLGAIWRNNKNELHTTSAEYTAEDFGDDTRVLAYLDTIGANKLYYRTQADGTRVYIYRALDGKIYEVTAENIKRSQQITYEYEMAKVSGQGLAAGGRVNYEGELIPIRPAEPDRPEGDKGILDQEIEARQVPKGSKENKKDRSRPYPKIKSAKHDTTSNEASVRKKVGSGLARNVRPSYVASSKQPQQSVLKEKADSITLNYGYEDKGRFSIEGTPDGLKVAPDGSFAAGIVKHKIVIYVPVQGENEEGKISPLKIKATSFSLSEDSLWMATTKGHNVTLWHRGKTVSQWNKSNSIRMNEKVKAMEFSPKGSYLVASLENGSVYVISQKGGDNFELKLTPQFAFDEQEDFMIVTEPLGFSWTSLGWAWMSANNDVPDCHMLAVCEKKIQNLYLSPNGKMLVGLNENTQCLWKLKRDHLNIGDDDALMYCRCVSAYENHTLLGSQYVTDVFIDDNFAMITRVAGGYVELSHVTREDESIRNFARTAFEPTVNNGAIITNAFYVPNNDRAAVIFSDGSMRMWQNIAKEANIQLLPDDPDFGELLYYNGAKLCFLVRNRAGHVIARRWL